MVIAALGLAPAVQAQSGSTGVTQQPADAGSASEAQPQVLVAQLIGRYNDQSASDGPELSITDMNASGQVVGTLSVWMLVDSPPGVYPMKQWRRDVHVFGMEGVSAILTGRTLTIRVAFRRYVLYFEEDNRTFRGTFTGVDVRDKIFRKSS